MIETERLLVFLFEGENGEMNNYITIKNEDLLLSGFDINELNNYYDNGYYVGYINIDINGYIEYQIYKPYRHKGYATESLIAIRKLCLSNSIQPKLYIDVLNDESKKTATASGFTFEGKYDGRPNSEKWGIKK